jgi:outer membrane protein insertion porin family
LRADRRPGRGQGLLALPLILLSGFGLAGTPPAAAAPNPDPGTADAGATGSAEEAAVVAVLPFRVHSAKPLDHLGDSLAELIRSRLEASTRVRVLDAATVRERLGEVPPSEPAAELRRIAEELGAAFVVTGSLTELAGSFSLDVRLTPAAIARPPHTLVVTAQRDDELLSRVDDVADRLVEEMAGAAPVVVARVDLVGAEAQHETIRSRLRTRAGEPYDPAVVRDDLAMLRGLPELADAEVETERGDEGVVVRFRLAAAGRALGRPGPRDEAVEVVEVQIRGNRRIDTEAIRARLGTRPGVPFRRAQIAKDVKAIHALGFFKTVRVFTETAPGGRIVIFDVEESPVVREISISGNESVDSEKIRDILTLTTGSTLDQPLLFENRERIAALYRAEGFYLADVEFEIEPLGEASVGVHFQVAEGKKLRLRKIKFVGNKHFSDKELEEGFQTKRWRLWSYATSWFDRSGTYSEPLFIQDLRSVEKKYTDAGYLRVEVGRPEVVAKKDGIEVTVKIVEGQRFRAGVIDVAGDNTVDLDALRQKLLLKEGEIFNRSHLTEDVAQLTEHYTDRGFYFATVTPLTKLSEEEGVVDVQFDVRKGPLYFIRRIDVNGNTRTVDSVIRREIPVVEGQLYSQRSILFTRARLQALGFFEEVDVKMEPTDDPDQLDLKIAVVERPTGSFSFGAGFSSQDKFVATGSLSETNLFGRGYRANATVDFGGSTQRFFLSFSDPRAFGSDFSLGLTGFNTDIEFDSFRQEQLGVDVVLGHALTEDNRARGFLRYSFANRKITQDTGVNAAAVIFRELFQDGSTTSMSGVNVSVDTRNDRLSPTRGFQAAASFEGAGIFGFAQFLRVEARAAWYLGAPRWMLDRSTFVVGARVGYALPFNSIADYGLDTDAVIIPTDDGNLLPLDAIDTDIELPLSERYFLGGLGQFQLRGYKARSVGPRRAILYQEGFTNQFIPVGRQLALEDPETGEIIVDINDIGDLEDLGDLVLTTVCNDTPESGNQGNGNGKCNNISDTRSGQFDDLKETDVIGGNKFISTTLEYRFPISETLGLQGVAFFDMGNSFAEGENLFDVTEWRYGVGGGVQWFSPFGPLAVVLGFPINGLSVDDSPVFEFSVGGGAF